MRLVLMIFFLIIFISILPIKIMNIDLIFLNSWLENKIFSIFFILLCFLFIVNGANLIDGFNGLLTINLIIINSVLLFVNLNNNHTEFSFFLSSQIIIMISFLLFNFPKAKMFLGDSGSYLFGSLVALNIIITNNLNMNISSFFLCVLLFYLFFEVFFSFFRKLIQKKSPIKPDGEHLHMLTYKLLKIGKPTKDCNYQNTLLINFTYCLLVFPSILLKESGALCKYWFFSLIIIYIFTYFRLNSFVKKKIDI